MISSMMRTMLVVAFAAATSASSDRDIPMNQMNARAGDNTRTKLIATLVKTVGITSSEVANSFHDSFVIGVVAGRA